MHAQRALGRWARTGSDKTKAAAAARSADSHSASEAPAERSAAHAAPAPAHSPFAEVPATEPSPGRQTASPSSKAAGQEEHPAAGNGHLIAASHSAQHGERVSLPPDQAEQLDLTSAMNKAHSAGHTPAGSPAFQPRSAVMSSTRSTGGVHRDRIQPPCRHVQCAHKTCRPSPLCCHACIPCDRGCYAERGTGKHAPALRSR